MTWSLKTKFLQKFLTRIRVLFFNYLVKKRGGFDASCIKYFFEA